MLSHLSHVRVQPFAALLTAAHQVPLSVGFSRQEFWSRLPCPPPGNLPDPGMEPSSLTSPALTGRFFTASNTWERGQMRKCPRICIYFTKHGTYEGEYYHHLSNSCGCLWGMSMPSPETVITPAYEDALYHTLTVFVKILRQKFWVIRIQTWELLQKWQAEPLTLGNLPARWEPWEGA